MKKRSPFAGELKESVEEREKEKGWEGRGGEKVGEERGEGERKKARRGATSVRQEAFEEDT